MKRFPITFAASGIGRNSRTKSPPRMPLYIYRNKRARSDRNYGRVCVKIVYASAVYLEFVPVSYLHVRIDDRPMKSFLSTRKLPTLLRWFIHAFCTRFIRRRLFLLLSVACHVGFVTRSLCEVHVIPRDDIYDSKKQQLILKLFRTVTLIVKKLFAFKKKMLNRSKVKEDISILEFFSFCYFILWDSALSNCNYLLNFLHLISIFWIFSHFSEFHSAPSFSILHFSIDSSEIECSYVNLFVSRFATLFKKMSNKITRSFNLLFL